MAAFMDRIQRRTGEPRAPEVPGGPMTPSRPAPFKNPPAAASAPIGRPPSPRPSFPGGAGVNLPVRETADRPAAPSTQDTGPARPERPGPQAGGTSPAARPGAAPTPIQDAQAEAQAAVQPLVQSFDRMPRMDEIAGVPEGVNIETPYGGVDREGNLTMNPEGEQRYREAIVQRRRAFGPHPYANDPNAPPPPVRLGRASINAFTGEWTPD